MDSQPAIQAFAPLDAGPATGFNTSLTITATTSASAMTALPGTTGIMEAGFPQKSINFYKQIQIANTTNGFAYLNFGQSGTPVVTVAAGYPVAPGSVVVITINGQYNYVSVILAAGATSGNVVFTRGQGL